jgi:hypothetical protein
MRKSTKFEILRTLKYRKQSVIVDILSILDGGAAAEVQIPGNEKPIDRVPIAPKTTVMSGDRRIMFYAENSRNLPFIIGDFGTAVVVVGISYWNQFQGVWSCARVVSYKITGDTMSSFGTEWTLEVTN